MSRKLIHPALAAAVLLVLAGCSSSGGNSTPAATTNSATAGSGASGSASAVAPESAAVGVGSGGGPAGSIPVIVEQKDLPALDVSGKLPSGDTVTVGIRSLAVDPNGKTMTLRVVLTPKLSSKTPDAQVRVYDLFAGTTVNFSPYLLDRRNLKRYDVIRSAAFQPMSSGLTPGAVNGNSIETWAVYAAPQDPVSSLEVDVRDNWAPFTNVPVTR